MDVSKISEASLFSLEAQFVFGGDCFCIDFGLLCLVADEPIEQSVCISLNEEESELLFAVIPNSKVCERYFPFSISSPPSEKSAPSNYPKYGVGKLESAPRCLR